MRKSTRLWLRIFLPALAILMLEAGFWAMSPAARWQLAMSVPEVVRGQASYVVAESQGPVALSQADVDALSHRLDPQGRGLMLVEHADKRVVVRALFVDPASIVNRLAVVGHVTLNLAYPGGELPRPMPPLGYKVVQPFPQIALQGDLVRVRASMEGHIQSARVTTDGQTGSLAVAFQFDPVGTREFCRITRQHVGERFAILIDDKVVTGPRINEPICAGSGQITGSFDASAAKQLADLLMIGALPARFTVLTSGRGKPPLSYSAR